PITAGDVDEVADRLWIHAADRRVERQAPEDLDALRAVLSDQIREAGGFRPMILDDDRALAARGRELGDLERIPRARIRVRAVMGMEVDRAGEYRVLEALVDRRRQRPRCAIRGPMRLGAFAVGAGP